MEKIRQNIFGIGEVYELQKEGQWVEKNRESYREYGYFGGGTPGPLSTVDRIDYSNDTATASVRGSLSFAKRQTASTGNSNFGYFGGGSNPGVSGGVFTTVDRINYSNDNTTVSVRGPLSSARGYFSATGNQNFGYFGGGTFGPAPLTYTTIDRIDYSNDLATASIKGTLSFARYYVASTGNSKFGYFIGGTSIPGSAISIVDRIDYSNDNVQTLRRNSLITIRTDAAGVGNANFGYFGAGDDPSPGYSSKVERINYSNDTSASLIRGPLTLGRIRTAATGNSNFGYFGGGASDVPAASTQTSITDRIDYSNDTATASLRGPLSSAKYRLSATSSTSFGGSPVSYLGAPWVATAPYGYFSGAALGALDRVDYTNDTAATTLRSQLSVIRSGLAATGNNNFGYYGGGGGPLSTVDRIDYSNDNASASVRGPLSLGRRFLTSCGNSNYGYFIGAHAGDASTIDRVDYTSDTSTASARGPLSYAHGNSSSASNRNFGYIFSGTVSPGGTLNSTSTISRINFSDDTSNALVRSFVNTRRRGSGGTGTENFGYFGGGANISPSIIYTSFVERVNYANDTSSTLIRGPLSLSRGYLSATGNSNFGYFGGGDPGPVSTVDRIDYSNDTQTASTRGPLSSARNGLAASSSQAYGGAPNTTTDPIPTYIRANTVWNDRNTLDVPYKRVLGSFGYYLNGIPYENTNISRIDYSNDTSTSSTRGFTYFSKFLGAATGNINFGYHYGGFNPSIGVFSIIERIDYSNDNTNTLLKTIIGSGGSSYRISGTGNSNFGYFGGGYSPSFRKLNYSNDNIMPVSGSSSISPPRRSELAATGNSNFGYFGGGGNGSARISAVDRINYSNDTAVASVRGPLSSARGYLSATGNSNFGYFGGGVVPGTVSIVDRIDYSNDTATASVRGPLSLARQGLAATGNSNFGYFGGGYASFTIRSTVDRVDYSNDTTSTSVRGSLSLKHGLTATTNATNS